MINKKTIFNFINLISLLFSLGHHGFCQSIAFHSKLIGFHVGGQITFDIYKPFTSLYLNMKRLDKPIALQQGEELQIYKMLGRRLILPGYLVFQLTGYPLSALSSHLETEHFDIYNRFNIIGNINILRSLGGGFEEPYAFSTLLGNVLFLTYTDSSRTILKQSGSALAGFLISGGNHQIYNNILIHDRWYQLELILTGHLNEPKLRRIFWNFRIGAKFRQIRILRNVFTVSFERSHTDRRFTGWSIHKNSIFRYRAHFPMPFTKDKTPAALQMITYGKKFPVSLFRKKVYIVLGFGVRWEWVRFYNHRLKQFDPEPSRQLTWLIQPNVEF